MAITVTNSPQILMPTFNVVPLVITSSNQTEESFQFIVDIYSASTAHRINRFKAPQNPDGYGVFQFQSILRNFVEYDKTNFSATGVTSAYPSRFNYDVQIGESYVYYWDFGDNFFTSGEVGFTSFTSSPHYFSVGDVVYIEQDPGYTYEEYNGVHTITSVPDAYSFVIDQAFEGSTPLNPGTAVYADNRVTNFSGLTAISALTINNAAIAHLDWPDYAVADYNMTALTANLWTDAPDGYEMSPESRAWVNVYSSTGATNLFRNMIVQTYDKNDAIVGTYALNLAGVGTSEKYWKIGCGPWNLSATTFAVSGSSTLPIIKENVASYSFWLQDSPGNFLTTPKTFNVNQQCYTKYEQFEIIFGDRKGSLLSRTFQLASTQGDDIEKSEYTKIIGGYNPTSNKWTYGSKDRGRTTLYTDAQTKYTVVSDWVDINDVDFLRQLYSSSEVYWNRGGTIIPIIVTNKFYPVPSLSVDRIFNLTLEFELAYNNPIPF